MQLLAALCPSHSSSVHQAGAGPDAGASEGCTRPQPPAAPVVSVPHVRQDFNWDCGVACVLMVLRACGLRGNDLESLRQRCGTRSIWTIDLAHLLAGCGLTPAFRTTMPGVNPGYAGERFYAEQLAEDAVRVGRLFQGAAAAGVDVQQFSVTLGELQALLVAGRHLVIALVDKTTFLGGPTGSSLVGGVLPALPSLASLGAGGGSGSAAAACSLQPPAAPAAAAAAHVSYTGHYVVLCGYDPAAGEFLICDPASQRALQRVPAARLDAARRSFGTDEDLLLIPIPEHALLGATGAAAAGGSSGGGE